MNNSVELSIKGFNNRESKSFEEVYLLCYKELYLYASMLYRNTTILAEDILHDIFIELWSSDKKFSTIVKLKSYIYTAIKNDFKNHINHLGYIDKYKAAKLADEDFGLDTFECEIYSEIDNILNILPAEYAKVIKLLLEGYKPSEVAVMLGRTPQNVYNIRHESVNILRSSSKLLNKDKLLLLTIFMSIMK